MKNRLKPLEELIELINEGRIFLFNKLYNDLCFGSNHLVQSCCSKPSVSYRSGKWICETCGDDSTGNSASDQEYLPGFEYYAKPEEKKCDCGADKTYGKNNKHHIFWCSKYKKD